MSYQADQNNGRGKIAQPHQRESQDPRVVNQQMGAVHMAQPVQPAQIPQQPMYQYAQQQYAAPGMVRTVPQMGMQPVHQQGHAVMGHPQVAQPMQTMYAAQPQQGPTGQVPQQGQQQPMRMVPVGAPQVMMYQPQYQPKMNISELVQVPPDLTAFASEAQFQQILWRVKEQTAINIITLNRNPQTQEVESVAIDAPSKESAQLARSLIETHFKLHARLKQAENRLHKVQNDLFTTQGEVASGMTVEFTIDPELVGLALGKKGARIKQIEAESKVTSIHVSGDTGRIIITGPDSASVNQAREQMELQEGCIPLESRQVEWLTSRNTNAMLSDIKEGADLLVVRVNQEKFTLDIVGTATAVRNAQLVIQTQMEYIDKQIEIEKVENATWDKLRQFRQQFGIRGAQGNEGGRGGGAGRDFGWKDHRGGAGGRGGGDRGGSRREPRDSLVSMFDNEPAVNAKKSSGGSAAPITRTVGSTAEQRERVVQAAMKKSIPEHTQSQQKGGASSSSRGGGGSGGLRTIVATPEPKHQGSARTVTVTTGEKGKGGDANRTGGNAKAEEPQQDAGDRRKRGGRGDKSGASASVDTLAAEMLGLKVNSNQQQQTGKGGKGGNNNRPSTAPAPQAAESSATPQQQGGGSSRRRKVEGGEGTVTASGIKLERREEPAREANKKGESNKAGAASASATTPAKESTGDAPLPKRDNNRRGDRKKGSDAAGDSSAAVGVTAGAGASSTPATPGGEKEGKQNGGGRRERGGGKGGKADNNGTAPTPATAEATTSSAENAAGEKKEKSGRGGRGGERKDNKSSGASNEIAGATLRDALKMSTGSTGANTPTA